MKATGHGDRGNGQTCDRSASLQALMAKMRVEAESRLDGQDASEMTIAVLCLIQELQEWNRTGAVLLTEMRIVKYRQWVTWIIGIVALIASLGTALEVAHLAPKL